MYISTAEPLNEEQQILYNSTVKMLLKEDLWTERDMYDAVHYLMIPSIMRSGRGMKERFRCLRISSRGSRRILQRMTVMAFRRAFF